MPKVCRKCGKEFPVKIKIDGVWKNLGNRKFCLECSPRGLHNTKSNLEGCRYVCKPGTKEYNKEKYTKNKAAINKATYQRQKKQRLDRKYDLVKIKGGCCGQCGYNKCMQALEMHHVNPEEKEFPINALTIIKYTWEKILKEAEKCILLCANCHRELHHPDDSNTPP